jgi:hypothetical protein
MTLSVKSSVDMWDAYGKTIAPPSATALGNFTTINGQTKNQFTVGTTNVYVCIQWTPLGLKGFLYSFDPTSTTDPVIEWIVIPQVGKDVKSTKPLRLSCYLLNGNKWPEGFVDVLSLPDQFSLTGVFSAANNPQTITNAFASEIEDLVDSHAKSKTYKASKFNIAKRFVMGPASNIGYQQYVDADGLPQVGTYVAAMEAGSKAYAMSTCIFRFNKVDNLSPDANTQSYTLHTYSQDGCRYPANTALASLARAQPNPSPQHSVAYHHMGSIVSQVSSSAHEAADIIGGVALARYGPQIVAGARNAIGAGGARIAGALGLGGGELGGVEAIELAAPLLALA